MLGAPNRILESIDKDIRIAGLRKKIYLSHTVYNLEYALFHQSFCALSSRGWCRAHVHVYNSYSLRRSFAAYIDQISMFY